MSKSSLIATGVATAIFGTFGAVQAWATTGVTNQGSSASIHGKPSDQVTITVIPETVQSQDIRHLHVQSNSITDSFDLSYNSDSNGTAHLNGQIGHTSVNLTGQTAQHEVNQLVSNLNLSTILMQRLSSPNTKVTVPFQHMELQTVDGANITLGAKGQLDFEFNWNRGTPITPTTLGWVQVATTTNLSMETIQHLHAQLGQRSSSSNLDYHIDPNSNIHLDGHVGHTKIHLNGASARQEMSTFGLLQTVQTFIGNPVGTNTAFRNLQINTFGGLQFNIDKDSHLHVSMNYTSK